MGSEPRVLHLADGLQDRQRLIEPVVAEQIGGAAQISFKLGKFLLQIAATSAPQVPQYFSSVEPTVPQRRHISHRPAPQLVQNFRCDGLRVRHFGQRSDPSASLSGITTGMPMGFSTSFTQFVYLNSKNLDGQWLRIILR